MPYGRQAACVAVTLPGPRQLRHPDPGDRCWPGPRRRTEILTSSPSARLQHAGGWRALLPRPPTPITTDSGLAFGRAPARTHRDPHRRPHRAAHRHPHRPAPVHVPRPHTGPQRGHEALTSAICATDRLWSDTRDGDGRRRERAHDGEISLQFTVVSPTKSLGRQHRVRCGHHDHAGGCGRVCNCPVLLVWPDEAPGVESIPPPPPHPHPPSPGPLPPRH